MHESNTGNPEMADVREILLLEREDHDRGCNEIIKLN